MTILIINVERLSDNDGSERRINFRPNKAETKNKTTECYALELFRSIWKRRRVDEEKSRTERRRDYYMEAT